MVLLPGLLYAKEGDVKHPASGDTPICLVKQGWSGGLREEDSGATAATACSPNPLPSG
jgi:hypothetical protein